MGSSSLTRDQTQTPALGTWSLSQWTTREVPHCWFWILSLSLINTLLLFSCSVASDSLRPHWLQHARLPCPSPSTGVCSNSCPLSQYCKLYKYLILKAERFFFLHQLRFLQHMYNGQHLLFWSVSIAESYLLEKQTTGWLKKKSVTLQVCHAVLNFGKIESIHFKVLDNVFMTSF